MSDEAREKLPKYAAAVMNACETMGETLEPDGDWAPVGVAKTDDPDVPVAMFPGEVVKEAPEVCVAMLNELKAVSVCTVHSAWMAQDVPGTSYDGFQLPPSMREDRVEVVMFMFVSRDESHSWMAEIKRSEDSHPELGEWKHSNAVGGAILATLRKGVNGQQE